MAKKVAIKPVESVSFLDKIKKLASNVAFVYGTIATIIGLITTIIIYVNKTTSQESRIETLEESNKHLESEVATLKGALDGVNNAVKIFLTNSPDLLNYKIDEIKSKVEHFHGKTTEPTTPGEPAVNRMPGQ